MKKTNALKNILIWLVLLLFLVNILLIYTTENPKAAGKKIWVDDDFRYPEESDGSLSKPFKNIQPAIDAAENGDTIAVLPGTYTGNLVIDKSISLTTEDPVNTIIISGKKSTYMIDITADSVSLEGFAITDTVNTSHRKAVIHLAPNTNDVVIDHNIINHSINGWGIYVENADGAVIKNNIINDTRGINIESSSSTAIINNTIQNSTENPAILIHSSNNNYVENNMLNQNAYGIHIQNSNNNQIKNNTICNNSYNGINIDSESGSNNVENNSIRDNSNNGIYLASFQDTIVGNNIYNNTIGIVLDGSKCVIRNNIISHSTSYGLYGKPGSTDNKIFNNSFINNYEKHAKEEGNNQWDYQGIGNYWDDYYGPDNDNNGIGEIPYTEGGVYDHYPTGIFQKPPVISDPSPANLETGVSRQPILSVKVSDPEGERIDVYFYYILNGTSFLIDVAHDVESGSRAAVPFYSTIQGRNAVYTYIGHGYDYICLWYAVAKDTYSENKSEEWIFSTLHVPIDNDKPIADIGGPYKGEVGETIYFDGSRCYDPDGYIEFYRWSFGDGTSEINVRSPTHTYKNPGTWNVSLVVIDNNGSSNISSTYVTIEPMENDPPVANINGYYTGNVGEPVQFTSTGSYDPDQGDAISYTWNFGDGNTATEPSPTHTYSKPGNYTVTLTVTDSQGLTDTDSTYVIIKKVSKEPGFEIIFLLTAILLVLLWKQNRK